MAKKFIFTVITAFYNTGDYLKDSIESVINQDIGFEENIQLILVDDGSTDDISLNIALKYQKQYPKNIMVLTKENGGQASARNMGLNFIEGDFVNFLDSDDKLSLNTFSHVYNFSKKYNVNILSIPLYFFDKIEEEHVLNLKFKEECVVDVFDKFNYPQLHISSSFIKSTLLKDECFDERFNIGEDAVLINKILLKEHKIAFLNTAKYFYRKRKDESSTLDNIIENDSFYFDKMEYFHFELINYSISKLGYVPKFIQYVIAYDLQWYFTEGKYDSNDENYKLFMNNFRKILNFIDEDIILNHEYMSKDKKSFLIFLKNDEFHIEKEGKNKIIFKTKNHILNKLHKHNLYLDFIDFSNNLLNISGCFISKCANDALSIEAIVEKNSDKLSIIGNEVEYPATYRKTIEKLNIPWRYYFNFEFQIPIGDEDNYKIYFKVHYNENNVSATFHPKIKFKEYSNLSKISNYYVKQSKIVLFKGNSIHIVKFSYKFMFKLEYYVLKKIFNSSNSYKFEILTLRLLYLFMFNFMKNKKVYLFMDRGESADDNAEHLFKYATTQNDGISKYYVLDENCIDFNRLSKNFKDIIKLNSFKHKFLQLFASKTISSHPDFNIINPYAGENFELISGIANNDVYFLQHGVTKDNIASWLRKYDKNLKLILTVSDKEYESFLHPYYNYDESIIQILGFPRFDSLNNNNVKKQIAIMPSWRHFFEYEDENGILNSEYYKNWFGFINNSQLINHAKKRGYKIIFKPHPKFEKFVSIVDVDDYIIIDENKKYHEIFNESAMIITDYSSIFFDFAYLKKPLFYFHYSDDYHFDINESYFDYEKMGFGEVVEDSVDLVEKVIKTIDNGCEMEEKYKRRVNEFFKYIDKNNCKRVYNWILKN